MVPALPATLGTPDDPPHSSSRPLHLPFLLPLPHSNEVFPGHTPQTPHVSVSPLLASLFLPSFTPSCPHTQSLCPICRASASAPPARLFSRGGFLAGLRSPLRFCPLEPCCPRAEVAALPPAGLGGGGAPAPCALCSYWTGLCVPLSANDGAGGNWRPGPARSRDEAQTVSERLWE